MTSKYRQIIQHIYENFSNSIICKDHFQKGRRGRARMVVRWKRWRPGRAE